MCCEKWRCGIGIFSVVFLIVWLTQIGGICSPLWLEICTQNGTIEVDGVPNVTVCKQYGLQQGLFYQCNVDWNDDPTHWDCVLRDQGKCRWGRV